MTPRYSYAWAVNHNVALLSLANVETDLLSYAQGRNLAPTSQVTEAFPVRETTMDGVERGEGGLSAAWVWNVMPLTAYQYILDTYFTDTSVKTNYRAMTIYARNDRFTYSRYNVYAFRPEPGTVNQDSLLMFNVVIRFNIVAEL